MIVENVKTRALLSAIRHSGQPMTLSDPTRPDHPIIAVNAAFEMLTGYPAAESTGRNCRFLQGPETDQTTTSRIRQCLLQQRGCIEWIVNYRRDGSVFWNLLFMVPVFDESGKLLHFFGNQRDMTDGRPPDLPDHTFGRADLPFLGQVEFDDALAAMATDATPEPDKLTRAVEVARRLNEVTTHLTPSPWSLPPLG